MTEKNDASTCAGQPRYSKQDMHQQTARISWKELELHFAKGVVLKVTSELDLVEVATSVANDNRQTIEALMNSGKLARLDTKTARDWSQYDVPLWAVVTAPWVLVQERPE